MAIQLIIKGSEAEAKAAAAERQVEFNYKITIAHGDRQESIGWAKDEEYQKVISWFHEDLSRKAPYPIGSLLHYQHREE